MYPRETVLDLYEGGVLVKQGAAVKIAGVTGVILAGGASSRMGSNKALLPYRGGRFIEAIYRLLAGLFDEVLVVTNTPDHYAFLPCRKVADIFPGMGALAGIHAGLHFAAHHRIFVVACDMPYLNDDLILYLSSLSGDEDAVIPRSHTGFEPVHAFYGGRSIIEIGNALAAGRRKIMDALAPLQVRIVDVPELVRFDPLDLSFCNINTPEDYFQLRERETGTTREEALPELAITG